MPSVLDPVIQEMTDTNTVIDSAVVFVTSVPTLIQSAVDKALANGASADQIQPVIDLGAQMAAKAQALKDALTANTPTP